MQTLSIKLPNNLAQKLVSTSEHAGLSKSEIVRKALIQFLQTPKLAATTPNSFLDLAGDLCGCVTGPKNLSTQTQHMEDYGK